MRGLVLALAISLAAGRADAAPSDPWAAFQEGATFTLESEHGKRVVATVTEVRKVKGERMISLAWSSGGKPLAATSSGVPRLLTIAATIVTVHFQGTNGFSSQTYPRDVPATEPRDRDSTWARNVGGAVCYGEGPHSQVACAAGRCDDHAICVDARGLSAAWGPWFPERSGTYARR